MSRSLWIVTLLLAAGVVAAQDVPENENAGDTTAAKPREQTRAQTQAQADKGPKVIAGMSILGNQEAPKSLVIVPWSGSVLGDSVGIPTMLDDSKQPIDREVFLRALRYYRIRSETRP